MWSKHFKRIDVRFGVLQTPYLRLMSLLASVISHSRYLLYSTCHSVHPHPSVILEGCSKLDPYLTSVLLRRSLPTFIGLMCNHPDWIHVDHLKVVFTYKQHHKQFSICFYTWGVKTYRERKF